MNSYSGGVNIEEVAEINPDAIKKYPLPLNKDDSVDIQLAEKIANQAFGN
jgi:succinyl-CoA synthetase beta subunit